MSSRLDRVMAGMGAGRSSGRVVSSTAKGGRTPGQQAAYDKQMREENDARLKAYQAQMSAENETMNKDSLTQYNQLMAEMAGLKSGVLGTGGTYDQMEALMQNMGTTGSIRIDQNMTKQLAANTQDNIKRGLGNTTIHNTTERGIRSDAEFNQQALDETVALAKAGVKGQRAGAQQNISGLTADSILSKQNVNNQSDLYAQLISQMFSA